MAKSKTYEMLLKIAGKADGSLKAACSAAEKNLATLGDAAKTAGKVVAGASVAIVGATAAMGTAAVNAAAEYQTQLANISTLLTGTEAEVAARAAEIGEQVLDVSNRTGVATDNLTDGMYQVISAFGDTADASSILETAAKSAAAGNATTADSINLLSAVTKGYGDTSAEAVKKAADLSFATVRLGQTSFPELAASMGKAIPLAGTLGVEQEQLFGAMATLTGVTGSTAEVVTQLKATMQGFLSPSKNMAAALKSLGYKSGQALLESEGLQGALDALKDSVHGNELAFAGLFSSVEAQTAVLAMAGTQSENLAMKTAEMYEAAGAANTAFERQADTLAYDIQMIKNLGANFLTQMGTNILPYVREFAQDAMPVATEALEKIGDYMTGTIIPAAETTVNWVMKNKDMILALVAGIGAAVVAYKVAKIGITAYNAAMSIYKIVTAASATGTFTLAGAMSALNIPMLAAAAAIGMLVAGGILLYKNWDTVKAKAAELGVKIDETWLAVSNTVTVAIAAIGERFPLLGAYLQGWWESISAAAENIKAIFSSIIQFIDNVFAGNWSGAWQNVVNIFGNLFGMIVNLAKAPINGVISAINWVLSKVNSISVTIPDWVPGVGGTTLGFNIPTIPQLAAGGIVTAPTILEAGEGGEPEAVLPLSKLAAMLQGASNIPQVPDMGNWEDGPEEAPLAQLAKMLDDWTRNNKPGPRAPGQGGAGSTDCQEPQGGGGNDAPPPEGGQNPPDGGVDTITFAPVFNFYGPTTPEQAKEAGQISFAEFKRMYQKMKAEERRKNLRASTH